MNLSKEKVMSLIQQKGISQNELARQINIRPGSLSNALSGKRGAGRKFYRLCSGNLKEKVL